MATAKSQHAPSQSALTEHTVLVGRREIYYAEAGTGDPVVLLHGGGPGASGLSNFSRNVDALAQSFRVIVPDMPGYGRSSKGSTTKTRSATSHCSFAASSTRSTSVARISWATPTAAPPPCAQLWIGRSCGPARPHGPGGIGTTRDSPRRALMR